MIGTIVADRHCERIVVPTQSDRQGAGANERIEHIALRSYAWNCQTKRRTAQNIYAFADQWIALNPMRFQNCEELDGRRAAISADYRPTVLKTPQAGSGSPPNETGNGNLNEGEIQTRRGLPMLVAARKRKEGDYLCSIQILPVARTGYADVDVAHQDKFEKDPVRGALRPVPANRSRLDFRLRKAVNKHEQRWLYG